MSYRPEYWPSETAEDYEDRLAEWRDELGDCDVTDCDRTAWTAVIGDAGDLHLCADHDGVGITEETAYLDPLAKAVREAIGFYDGIEEAMPDAFRVLIAAARSLRAGQRLRWCEAHHDVVDYGRDDACRIALRIDDEKACDIMKAALVRLSDE